MPVSRPVYYAANVSLFRIILIDSLAEASYTNLRLRFVVTYLKQQTRSALLIGITFSEVA